MEGVIGYYFSGIPGVDMSWFPGRPSEPEIDFVLTIGLQRIPVEVKYCRRQKAGDLDGLHSFCSKVKYNAPFGLIITQDQQGEVDEHVFAVPAAALLNTC